MSPRRSRISIEFRSGLAALEIRKYPGIEKAHIYQEENALAEAGVFSFEISTGVKYLAIVEKANAGEVARYLEFPASTATGQDRIQLGEVNEVIAYQIQLHILAGRTFERRAV